MPTTKKTTLLEGFVPAPTGEQQQKHLVRLTKYEKLGGNNPVFGTNRVRLDDDGVLDVVAVLDDTTKTVAAVMRNFTGEVELEGGKTFRTYEVIGMRIFGKGQEAADEAFALLGQLHEQQIAEVVSDIPGWA